MVNILLIDCLNLLVVIVMCLIDCLLVDIEKDNVVVIVMFNVDLFSMIFFSLCLLYM